jgi:hypothetical protein
MDKIIACMLQANSKWIWIVSFIIFGFWSSYTVAQPPFLTESSEPTETHFAELYFFTQLDRTKSETNIFAPAFDVDYGIFPNSELHLLVPIHHYISNSLESEASSTGLGDIEIGFLYSFLEEGEYWPQMGIFPLFELPTGNANRNLGNGKIWYQLPFTIQKKWNKWVTTACVGHAIDHANEEKNYWFGGLLIEREFSEKLNLGLEIFSQSPTSVYKTNGTYTVINIGGHYNLTPNFSVLFSAGHTVIGTRHLIGAISLYWKVGDLKRP